MKKSTQEKAMNFVLLCAGTVLLAACGGDSQDYSVSTQINVALPVNGATVTATYDPLVTAAFVNDGDSTTAANFWAGNVTGDTVTIDFGQLRSVKSVTVYTNDTSFNSTSPAKYIEVSANNTSWQKTAQPTSGDIACSSFLADAVKIRCTFSAAQSIRYFRVRIDSATPADQRIIEMEALGR